MGMSRQRSIDQSVWRCFCRISCLCDFCGCSCGCGLTTHTSFSRRCALHKNIFLSVCSHKGLSIFNLGLFWTGTQWVLDCHSRFVHKMTGFTITICNKITVTVCFTVNKTPTRVLLILSPPPPSTPEFPWLSNMAVYPLERISSSKMVMHNTIMQRKFFLCKSEKKSFYSC